MEVDKRIFAGEGGAGLDKDTDPRFVGNGFYINGRNVNVMTNGNRFILTNMKGNTLKSYSLNAGDNLCIGGFDDKGNETVYFFIWNAAGDHLVLKYEYNVTVDAISTIAEGPGFNFKPNKLITGIDIVNDRFLVWAQEDEEVGCLDLEDLPVGTITAANRWQIELAKVEDPAPLECFYLRDSSTNQNTLTKRSYQFRYRYIYEGGFRSPFSTISKVPIPDTLYMLLYPISSAFVASTVPNQFDNTLSLTLPRPTFNKVVKIELYVRYATYDNSKDSSLWYKFKTVNYEDFSDDQPVLDIKFDGTEALEPADTTETLTESSFFPKSVKEIVFLPSNVLAFLNFKEGNDASSVTPKVKIVPEYKLRPSTGGTPTTTLTVASTPASETISLKNVNYNLDIDSVVYRGITVGGTPRVGDILNITLAVFYQDTGTTLNPVGISTSPSVTNKLFFITYIVKEDDTTTAIIAQKLRKVINSTDTRFEGFGGIIATRNGSQIRIHEGVNNNDNPYQISTTIFLSAGSVSVQTKYGIVFGQDWEVYRTKKTLKRNSLHNFAIQYRDGKGRRSGAIPLDEIYIKGQDQTAPNISWVELKFFIDHTAPTWAKYYDILYTKNQTSETFLQVACNLVKVDPSSTLKWRAEVYAQLSSLYEEYQNENGNLDSYNYNYLEGDRIKLLGVIAGGADGDDLTLFSEQADLPLTKDDGFGVQFEYNISSLTPSLVSPITNVTVNFVPITTGSLEGQTNIVRTTGDWLAEGYYIGQKVTINDAAITANNVTTVVADVTSTTLRVIADLAADTGDAISIIRSNKVLVEVYRPKTEQSRLYYEVALSGTVDSNGYHSGNVQNQTGSQQAIIAARDFGDVYETTLPRGKRPQTINVASASAFIECEHMSPLKVSAVTDIGRSNLDLDSDTEIERDSAITYTQPIIEDSNTNGLSIVLPTSIYNDFGSDFGSIQKAFLRQDRVLVVFFEDKVGQMGVFSELQKSPNGTIAYATDSLTNQINFYAYDGGIGKHPESFAYYDTVCYFLSPRNNAVCRLSNDGITEVSKYGMTTWYNDNLDVKSKNLAGLKAVGVYDERNTSYILSLSQSIDLIYLGPLPGNSLLVRPDIDGVYGSTLIQVGDTLVITDTSLPAITYIRTVANVTYDSIGGTFTISWEEALPSNIQIASLYKFSKIDTLMFNEVLNRWVSFLDFSADMMATCGIDFVSWNRGNTYLHNSNEVRGSYYGTLYPAEVTVPFNAFPGVQKRYQTIEQEATSPWISPTDGDVSIQDGNQKSQLFGNYYSQYQPNEYAAAFRQDTLTPNRVNPLLDGYDLRGKYMTLRLSNSSTTEEKLAAIAVTFFPSESSL